MIGVSNRGKRGKSKANEKTEQTTHVTPLRVKNRANHKRL